MAALTATPALTRGVSFRRQGSSGISWAENWVISDDGVVVARAKSGPLLQQQQLQQAVGTTTDSMPSAQQQIMMQRCRSTHEGCSINYRSCIMGGGGKSSAATPISAAKSSGSSSPLSPSSVVGWLKKAFTSKSEY